VRLLWLAGILGCLAGCAGANEAVPAPDSPRAGQAAGVAFAEWEGRWLAELGATDPRLAMRLPVRPSAETLEKVAAAAVIRGDSDLGVVGGAIDLFSFGERTLHLRSLRAELTRGPDDGTPACREERRLLGRLLDGEESRVATERESADSASELVRAVVATWGRPATPRDVQERERLVQRGLVIVLEDARAGRLLGPRATELEDALDALERLAVPAGYPGATEAITSLRVELGKAHAHPTPRSASAAPSLEARLDAFLGPQGDLASLRGRLREEEATLRSDVKHRLAKLPDHTANEVLAAAAPHVGAELACPPDAGAPPARALRPPPERALVCDALHLVASANLPLEELIATVTLHDDVAVALWALDLDRAGADLDATRAAHPLLSAVTADRQDRLARAALVSPTRAIAPGVAVAILDAEGPGEQRDRATRWLAFGDAPFDVVTSYLAPPKEAGP